MSRIRLVPVILIALISLGVLVAGWYTYQRVNVVNPLKTGLQSVSGVQSVQVQTGNPDVVEVRLGKVKDLQTTYSSISRITTSTLGSSVDVRLQDNRDDELTTAEQQSFKPFLYEAVAKGNFPEMFNTVRQNAAKMNIDARVTMDDHNIYVQLIKDSHYLYDVLPYTIHQGGGAS